MAILSQGSFSINKIIDGKTLTFSLSSNLGYSQIESKDPKSYNPNYTTSNLYITPYLSVSGLASNAITSAVTWKINGDLLQTGAAGANNTKYGATVESSGAFRLGISKNMTDVAMMTIRAEYTYVDSITNATSPVVVETTITKVENTGANITARIITPNGDKFFTSGGAVQDLKIKATLVRGAEDDLTDVSYEWFINVNGTYYKIISGTKPAGADSLPGGTLFEGWDTNELTVKSTAVLNLATFKCKMTDTDSASSTHTKSVEASATLIDMTDPYEIVVQTPNGNAVTSSNGVNVRFEVWQNGNKLPDTFYNSKTLKFWRNSSAGAADTTWVPSPAFTGWTPTAGIVTRAYTAGSGTDANRTVAIVMTHLPASDAFCGFGVSLEG